jgi:hypothetical protein
VVPSVSTDEGREALTVLFVVDADDGGLGDAGMAGQDLLHLDRVDVLAAGHDHLVVTPDDEEPPRSVEVTEDAMKPSW